MTPRHHGKIALALAAAALIGLSALACSGGGSSPTAPDSTLLTLSGAALKVGGQTVNGGTFPPGHGQGMPARFEATLRLGDGPATGGEVWVDFRRPGAMGRMESGRFPLYDDGTHGDPLPGDGVYCFEDWMAQYACHTEDARPGQYRYDFFGHHQGRESNHLVVTVTLSE